MVWGMGKEWDRMKCSAEESDKRRSIFLKMKRNIQDEMVRRR
jgi:hypothetical protein